jgi:uncharacterized membrane protein YfcA
MNEPVLTAETILLPVFINAEEVLIIGGGAEAERALEQLLAHSRDIPTTVMFTEISEAVLQIARENPNVSSIRKRYEEEDFEGVKLVIAASGNKIADEHIKIIASGKNCLVNVFNKPLESDFQLYNGKKKDPPAPTITIKKEKRLGWQLNSDQAWKRLTSRLILAFFLMVLGHVVISYLPMPKFSEVWDTASPYLNLQFLFFVTAGFLAQMVDGTLGMGYGVTSATCLMTFGISPVSVSAAIHTSEIFTTATSGYSHYKFGNVNKKMFKHLVIPGVIGAILGAILLVFLGEKYGKWLMPVIAAYAFFLGLKILIKAFQQQTKSKKIKRLGWLAWTGGFLDSFGGGGWGPIVTSHLISKGRSPKYTIGTVNLTEFFITMASAVTFFLSVGVSHWNVVLGLLIGGSVASPIAARLSGRLPRKTMMIAVGIMIMIWCTRMLIKSFV